MRTKKIALIILIIALVSIIFTACNEEEDKVPEVNELLESAVFFDRGEKILKQDYLATLSMIDEYSVETTTVLIDNKQNLDSMFIGFPTSVDFETERVIVYIFTTYNYGFPCYLTDVAVENGICDIKIFQDYPQPAEGGPTPSCASAPTVRALVVKVNSIEIISANIQIYINRR